MLTLGGVLTPAGRVARAQQIVPDGSLGAEGSVVTTVAPQVEQIDGGAMRGATCFIVLRSLVLMRVDGEFREPRGD